MSGIHSDVTSKEQAKKIISKHSEVIQSSLVYIDENCYSFDKGIGFTLFEDRPGKNPLKVSIRMIEVKCWPPRKIE
jgi:hypothetical protein